MFANRTEAGRRLAAHLDHYRADPDSIVVGLPRGGVPVAAEVAQALALPLDVIVVRKLGVPTQPEFAMGAIGEDDVRVVDDLLIRRLGVTADQLAAVERRERAELRARADRFRAARARQTLTDKVVIVVDDGVATGSTARAACQVARAEGARRVVLAVPVAPADWEASLGSTADEYVAVETHEFFGAVGNFYRDFSPTADAEVVRCLGDATG